MIQPSITAGLCIAALSLAILVDRPYLDAVFMPNVATASFAAKQSDDPSPPTPDFSPDPVSGGSASRTGMPPPPIDFENYLVAAELVSNGGACAAQFAAPEVVIPIKGVSYTVKKVIPRGVTGFVILYDARAGKYAELAGVAAKDGAWEAASKAMPFSECVHVAYDLYALTFTGSDNPSVELPAGAPLPTPVPTPSR